MKEKTFKEKMIEEGGNLGWCKPVMSDDETICYVDHEGEIVRMQMCGKEVSVDDAMIGLIERLKDELEWKDGDCRDCPWVDECELMDETLAVFDYDDDFYVFED